MRPGDPAVEAVYRMGPSAIPHLRRALRLKDSFSVKALHSLHAHLPGFLERHLPPDPHPLPLEYIACAAAQCLAAFGPAAHDAMPELLDALKEPQLAFFAYQAACQIGPTEKDLPTLLGYLNSTNPAPADLSKRLVAAELIGMVGVANRQILDSLIRFEESPQIGAQEVAITALGMLGPKANTAAMPVLTRNLNSSNASVRVASADALWRVQGKTNPPIAFLVNELEFELKTPGDLGIGDYRNVNLPTILRILKEIGPEASNAVPLLRNIRNSPQIILANGSLPLFKPRTLFGPSTGKPTTSWPFAPMAWTSTMAGAKVPPSYWPNSVFKNTSTCRYLTTCFATVTPSFDSMPRMRSGRSGVTPNIRSPICSLDWKITHFILSTEQRISTARRRGAW